MARLGLLAATGLFGLCGCLGSDFSSFAAGGDVERNVIRTTTLYHGDIVVRGPEGYCIDRRSLKDRTAQGFVMLASCEALSGVRGQAVEPVIMTLTVLPGKADTTPPTATEIAASMPGTQVIKAVEGEGLSLVHFASGGDQALAGKDPRHWRGAMAVNGHLIGLALYARQGGKMAGDDGQSLLTRLAVNTKSASPVRPPVVATVTEETSASPPGSLGTLLGGLFPDSS
ncbi:MAG: hypothetical protein AAFQ05_13965 [Pseudomonadota bacterium]